MRNWQIMATGMLSVVAAGLLSAQEPDATDSLVSSWTLVSVTRESAGDPGGRGGRGGGRGGARGVLILDRAGNVFEFFSTASRNEPEAPEVDPQRTFANFGGFWGRYSVDESSGQIAFESAAGVSPSMRGVSFSRSFELNGDRLAIRSADEPQTPSGTQWVWQRAPTVEHLTPAYREVMGFWQHVEERRVDQATGEIQSRNERAPSVIVYAPGGFVGVHFPSLGREPFTSNPPSAEEAQAGLRGYIGYFGTLGVFPGEVSHNILAGISPGTGSILRRYADIDGDELIVTLGGSGNAANRPTVVTEVVLRRLSGVDDMLPSAR